MMVLVGKKQQARIENTCIIRFYLPAMKNKERLSDSHNRQGSYAQTELWCTKGHFFSAALYGGGFFAEQLKEKPAHVHKPWDFTSEGLVLFLCKNLSQKQCQGSYLNSALVTITVCNLFLVCIFKFLSFFFNLTVFKINFSPPAAVSRTYLLNSCALCFSKEVFRGWA